MNDCAMCNFFQEYESSKYREKRFGYPYPVTVSKQFLDIRIRLQTHYPAGYPTGKTDSDHLCLLVAAVCYVTLLSGLPGWHF